MKKTANMIKKLWRNMGKNNADVWGYSTLGMHIL